MSIIHIHFKIFNKSISSGKQPNGHTILTTPLEDAKEICLTYAENEFSIEFAALDFTDPYKNKYSYKMEGFDQDWRAASGDQRLVSYTNLDPGTYLFKIKGTNSNGIWSDEKTITILISPPFWETWWFRITSIYWVWV